MTWLQEANFVRFFLIFSESSHCCRCPLEPRPKAKGSWGKRASKRGSWEPEIILQLCFTRDETCPVRTSKEIAVDPRSPPWWGPPRTLEHLQVAQCPASGGLEICISAGVGTDNSRNRRASGLYVFDFPFIHHLNVLKPIIKEISSVKSSILPSVMCLFLINLTCPWCLSGDNVP